MVDTDGTDIDEFGEVVLVWHVVTMPCNDIEGTVVLLAGEVLATHLVDDLPWVVLGDVVLGLGMEEVTAVCKTIGSERSQFRKLEVRAPDLQDVASCWSLYVDLESLTALDDADLARLNVQGTELSLDIKGSLLRNDEVVAV